jgi:hypothetical protein
MGEDVCGNLAAQKEDFGIVKPREGFDIQLELLQSEQSSYNQSHNKRATQGLCQWDHEGT